MKQRRILSLLLALALCVTLLPQLRLLASADQDAPTKLTDGTFEFTVQDGEATLTGLCPGVKLLFDVVIPSEIDGIPVTAIGYAALQNQLKITEIIVPEGVEEIGRFAFRNAQRLASVQLPESLKTIGSCAFAYCESLKEIKVPSGVTDCDRAFDCYIDAPVISGSSETVRQAATAVDCPYVDLATGNKTEPDYTTVDNIIYALWPDHASISSGYYVKGDITVPETVKGLPVTRVGRRAFERNYEITSLSLPNGVTDIGDYALAYCESLTQIYLPESVKRIGEYAFWDCIGTQNVYLPHALEEIGRRAFSYCYGVRMVYLSPSFRADRLYNLPWYDEKKISPIGEELFYVYAPGTEAERYVQDMEYVEADTFSYALPEDFLGYIGNSSIYRIDGDHLTLLFCPVTRHPESLAVVEPYAGGLPVTQIAADAFREAASIRFDCTLILPPTVTTIEAGAFSRLSNFYVYIPSSVTTISANAFPSTQNKCLIIGQNQSAAQSYARQHGIRFQEASISFLPFGDVPTDAWYYMPVLYAYYNGLMSGVSSSKFSPTVTMTRAMLVQVLYNLAGSPSESYGFRDVPENAWYADAVNWAANNGIVAGTSETTFSPNANITREQVATILYRFASKLSPVEAGEDALKGFEDADKVSDFAVEAMRWAVTKGLIQGTASNRLSPKGKATRAEVAAILQRFVILLLTETPQTRGASPVFPDLQQFQEAVNLDLAR